MLCKYDLNFCIRSYILCMSKVAWKQVSFPIVDGHSFALVSTPSTTHGIADGWPCVMGYMKTKYVGKPVKKFKLLEHKFKAIHRENQDQLHTSGIYVILNIVNGHKYVGQSKDISNRWDQHRQLLRRNKHNNLYLQNAWNKYTEQSFKFVIAELCPDQDLNDREQYWIERVSPEYNIVINVYENCFQRARRCNCPDGWEIQDSSASGEPQGPRSHAIQAPRTEEGVKNEE